MPSDIPVSVGIGHYKGNNRHVETSRTAVLVYTSLSYSAPHIVSNVVKLGSYSTPAEFEALVKKAENDRRFHRCAIDTGVICDLEDAKTQYTMQREGLKHEGKALMIHDRSQVQ